MPAAHYSLNDIPRLPVLGWEAFRAGAVAPMPSILDLPHCVFTTSGRSAIGLALEFLGIGPGDLVLVPTYNCPTMIAPVLNAGAQPLFFPIDAEGQPRREFFDALDPRGVRAVIAAHYFGLPQSFGWLRRWCDDAGLKFIEDCAHAFFGQRDGVAVGASGDLAIASLTKFFPVVEGGCLVSSRYPLDEIALKPRSVVTNASKLWDSFEMGVRHARFPGLNLPLQALYRTKELMRGRAGRARPQVDYNGEPQLWEFEDPLMHAAIAAPLPRLLKAVDHGRIIDRRRRNYLRWVDLLRDAPGARPLFADLPEGAAPYVFPLEVDHAAQRYGALRASRMPLFRWDRIWPGTPAFEEDKGLEWAGDVFQLACHQDLQDEDLERMAAAVHEVFLQHDGKAA
jgi:perosamine synthetase